MLICRQFCMHKNKFQIPRITFARSINESLDEEDEDSYEVSQVISRQVVGNNAK